MKTKLSAPFSELRGKLGALVGQQRKSGGAVVLLSAPYAVSQQERSTAQQEQNEDYAFFLMLWQAESPERKEAYNQQAEPLQLSGWNLYLKEMSENMNMKNIAFGRVPTLEGVWTQEPDQLEKFTDGKINTATGEGITNAIAPGDGALTVDLGRVVFSNSYIAKLGVWLTGGETDGMLEIYSSLDGITYILLGSFAVTALAEALVAPSFYELIAYDHPETWQFRYLKFIPFTALATGFIHIKFYELIVETIPEAP